MSSASSRPVHDLTEDDFEECPVWKFGADAEDADGTDESHVYPVNADIRLDGFGSFAVCATYRLKNGEQFPGVVQVDLLGSMAFFTPMVVFVRGKALDPLLSDTGKRIQRITKLDNTRPLSWQLTKSFIGESRLRTGTIRQSRTLQALQLLFRLMLLRLIKWRMG